MKLNDFFLSIEKLLFKCEMIWFWAVWFRWKMRTKERGMYIDFGSLALNIFAGRLFFREFQFVHTIAQH